MNRVKNKVTEFAANGGVVINKIVRLIDKLYINVIIEYWREYKKKVKNFIENPEIFILQECDRKVRELRVKIENNK